ncbi:MAG: ZIP family metal transporter [Patescibacteria group bacterium]|nr:ZIP family metal transporter [Patescibacteria group bacterium]
MQPIVILISFGAFIATLVGGLVAIWLKDKLHLILGFSAGAVIAVAFFDLLPEAIGLGKNYYSIMTVTSIVAAGFLVYLILDRMIFLHAHADEHDNLDMHKHDSGGVLGAGSLSVHSFLDGVAIGLAFQVSVSIGAIVAVAVLVHDFSDGINTVNLILKNQGESSKAFRWLIVDALAPVIGVTSTLFFQLPENALAIILALFAGFFLYIGASDLIPESHHAHPRFMTTLMTLLGAAILYMAINMANL